MSDAPEVTPAPAKASEPHPLDALTGGAFSAATSGERASRIRDWLATQPTPEQLQEVFKELSGRDKGAARAVRERLDEIRRAKGQEAIAAEWAEKATALLDASRFHIADALAWQRDAAKAGAPLSREPLASLKARLAERMKVIEDLQHRVQVQREAAVLLAQRIDVLSTKPWRDAQAALEALRADVERWQQQADELSGDPAWPSVEARFPPQLEASRTQLLVVWNAFQPAIAQAAAAAENPEAPLPPVPVWAEELRIARGGEPLAEAAASGAAAPAAPARAAAKTDPAVREKAEQAVRAALVRLQEETAQGHGKASAGAATALRTVLKQHGRHIDAALEHDVHTALVAAGELQGLAALERRPGARGPRGQGGRTAQASRRPGTGRPQDPGKPAPAARAVEADRPGWPGEPCPVEEIRRGLQCRPQGGGGLAGEGAFRRGRAQSATPGADPGTAGLDGRTGSGRRAARLEAGEPCAAPVLRSLARGRPRQ